MLFILKTYAFRTKKHSFFIRNRLVCNLTSKRNARNFIFGRCDKVCYLPDLSGKSGMAGCCGDSVFSFSRMTSMALFSCSSSPMYSL